jgi:CRP/FNR family transcriptional regulator
MSSMPRLLREAAEVEIAAGQRVFAQGQQAHNYLVVTAGSVKVFARSGEGREVVLYRVGAGEMCALTTSCMLGRTPYPAEAVTETDVRARIIGSEAFDRALSESAEFRQFVFASFGQRLTDVLQRMEQLVLDCVRSRLARCLVQRADADGMVVSTHEALALEVGTAREVVSRHLKSMEQSGLVRTQRGRIFLLRREILELL